MNTTMNSPRSPLVQELPQVFDFLNSHLRPGKNWSIKEEYPQVFQGRNLHNLKIIWENQGPVTHAAIRPLILKTPQFIYKIATIGSVVTDPSYRGRGYSSQVIQECLLEAQKQDCEIAILWSDLHNFYRKQGFELAGYEEYFQIHKSLETHWTGPELKFLETSKVDPQAILKLYSRHSISSPRNPEDIKRYLNIPNTHLYTAWYPHQELAAFAVEGKGADLTDFIHEWGGQTPELLELFNFIFQKKGHPFTVMAGPQSVNLMLQFQKLGLSGTQGALGLIKIINIEKFGKKISQMARQYGIQKFELQNLESGQIRLSIENEEALIRSEQDLTSRLFGPQSLTPLFSSKLTTKIQRIFPLPLWIWGWDSI